MIGHKLIGWGPDRTILLHGWLSDSHIFDPLLPFFDPERTTLALVDFPGYGMSAAMGGPFTVERLAAEIIGLAHHLGWPGCRFVGHSMAGMVGLEVALQAPGLLHSAVMLAPVPPSGFPLDDGTKAFFQSAADDDAALATLFDTLTGKRHHQDFSTGMARLCRQQTSREAFLGYLDAWTGTNFESRARGVRLQHTVVAGKHDGALGPDVLRKTWINVVPGATLAVIEGAGHYPMIEAMLDTVDAIHGRAPAQAAAA
jgi:pimeloyl-ACP methyl ester carboxylesterase